MEKPFGFIDKNYPNHVCRLKKAIYDLKQAPRAWYTELCNYLISIGFTNSTADASLFIYKQRSDVFYLLVYVDDIIVTCNLEEGVTRLISSLAKRFSIKDLGRLSYFLGVEVIPQADGLFLSQRKYICDILHKAGMAEVKPSSTPICLVSSNSAH